VEGKVFIDATYEGDLMARAGVSYSVGREGVDDFNESWAGRRAILLMATRCCPVFLLLMKMGTCYHLSIRFHWSAEGQADKAAQGYGFRLTVTTNKENRIPFPEPETTIQSSLN